MRVVPSIKFSLRFNVRSFEGLLNLLALCIRSKYIWALTWEWAFSIHPAKKATWALIQEWVLTWDTTVIVLETEMSHDGIMTTITHNNNFLYAPY